MRPGTLAPLWAGQEAPYGHWPLRSRLRQLLRGVVSDPGSFLSSRTSHAFGVASRAKITAGAPAITAASRQVTAGKGCLCVSFQPPLFPLPVLAAGKVTDSTGPWQSWGSVRGKPGNGVPHSAPAFLLTRRGAWSAWAACSLRAHSGFACGGQGEGHSGACCARAPSLPQPQRSEARRGWGAQTATRGPAPV